jgi:sigma-E factor negative regulatory protein RseB
LVWLCAGVLQATPFGVIDATAGEEGGASASDWLVKISNAAHRLNYDGTFVYRLGDQIEVMRIVHKVDGGRVRERLVSLNGAPREIIRDDKAVLCYLSDEKSVAVNHRGIDKQKFPALLPDRLQDLDANYRIELGRPGRIAGRSAQQVLVQPRDQLRYGYHLWADRDSGLLLKAEILDEQGLPLEQFLFTHLSVGGPIPDSALVADKANTAIKLKWLRGEDGGAETLVESAWTMDSLPKGFRQTGRLHRKVPQRNAIVEHHIFSDGLASVSVFFEKLEKPMPAMEGVSHIGAVHAYGTRVSEYQITAVGEAPAETVTQFAKSATLRR